MSEGGDTFLKHIENLNTTTFSEFVDIILGKCGKNYLFCNEHWEPQYVHCNYCDVKYNFIGRVESLENDIEFIAHNINMTLNLTRFNLHLHPTGVKESENPTNNLTKLKEKTEKIDKTKFISGEDRKTSIAGRIAGRIKCCAK